jgi:hypothetical protein
MSVPVPATVRRLFAELRTAWTADSTLGGPRLRDYPVRRP